MTTKAELVSLLPQTALGSLLSNPIATPGMPGEKHSQHSERQNRDDHNVCKNGHLPIPLTCSSIYYIPTIRKNPVRGACLQIPVLHIQKRNVHRHEQQMPKQGTKLGTGQCFLEYDISFQVLHSSSSLSSPQLAHWPILRVSKDCECLGRMTLYLHIPPMAGNIKSGLLHSYKKTYTHASHRKGTGENIPSAKKQKSIQTCLT